MGRSKNLQMGGEGEGNHLASPTQDPLCSTRNMYEETMQIDVLKVFLKH